jgi:hypothetical protein
MRPIAAMLLRFGVGYRAFSDASKTAFIEAASEDFGSRGRPANISRIALMTGISRKDVRTFRDNQVLGIGANPLPTHFPAEVLRRWFTTEQYCDSTGLAKPLVWDKDPDSFVELVRSCGASLSPVAMRNELIRVGAVTENDSGVLIPLRRYFIADSAKDRLAEGIQFGIRPLALTIVKNVESVGLGALRFQRVVDSYSIPVERRAALEEEITARLRQFSEEIDDLLSEIADSSGNGESSAVGVGLFYFEDCDKPSRN